MASETTLINVSRVLTAANKPCDELYKDNCPLDKERSKRAKGVVKQCIEKTFLSKMKELDGLFGNLFLEIYHAGSFYDGLRIVEPTEFDLNIILKMPFPDHLMKLDFGNGFPIPSGFARYYCSSPPRDVKTMMKLTEDQERLFLAFFEENVLLPLKVRDWFRTVVDKAVRYYEDRPFYPLTIQWNKRGKYSPAATLKIKVDYDLEIDIDLVPVFSHGKETLVPKTYPSEEYQKVWRLSYPSLEKDLLKGQSCAKKVIRMLKLFRDQLEDWKWVCSYYLKTAVMLEIKEGRVWSDKQLSEKFEKMLKILQQHFERKCLPSRHFPELNLLKHIKRNTLYNAERRLNRIIGTDKTVEIADILRDMLTKSGKQKNHAKIKLTSLLERIVSDKVSGGSERHSSGDVEDLLEEAFPYEHSENEINKDDDDEEEFFPHKFINNEISEDDAGRGWCALV